MKRISEERAKTKRRKGKNEGKRKERTLSTPQPRPILLQGSSLLPAPALAPLSLFRRCRRALQVHFHFRFRTDKENWSVGEPPTTSHTHAHTPSPCSSPPATCAACARAQRRPCLGLCAGVAWKWREWASVLGIIGLRGRGVEGE
jgi:hypothetical protein